MIDLIANMGTLLITIDIGIYAIANTLLSKQIKRNILYVQKRLFDTQQNIEEKNKGSPSDLENIQKEIIDLKREIKTNQDYLKSFMVSDSVIKPCLSLALAVFLISILEINTVLNNLYALNILILVQIFIIIIGFLYGIYKIYKTLIAIEFASFNIPLPILKIRFRNGEKELGIKKDDKNFEIIVENDGYEIGEMTELTLFFPPEIQLNLSEDYTISKQTDIEKYPNYNGISIEVGIIHINSSIGYNILLKGRLQIPNQYKIFTEVNAKDILPVEDELILNIKDMVKLKKLK